MELVLRKSVRIAEPGGTRNPFFKKINCCFKVSKKSGTF